MDRGESRCLIGERGVRRAARRLAFEFAALALLVAGCGEPGDSASGGPNLLLVTFDTTRSDHLSSYGHSRATTPELDALARGGVRFANSYAASASTAPSHASLFTSQRPPTHGLVKNGLTLPATAPTLAERLQAAGYQTAGIVSSFVLDARFGLDRGFERWEDDLDAAEGTDEVRDWEGFSIPSGFDRRADYTTGRALRWLREQRDPARPFLLFVHYFDPHLNYQPPEPHLSAMRADLRDLANGGTRRDWLAALYDGEIRFVDHELGRLLVELDTQGLRRNTLVAVTSDHGEGLMEHGVLDHAINLYEEAVRVPLVVSWPSRIPSGQVVDVPVESIDVLPTLLDLLEVEDTNGRSRAPGMQGRSLAPAILAGVPVEARPIRLYRRPYEAQQAGAATRVFVDGELHALRVGRFKYIEGDEQGVRELYDLEADPGERIDLSSREPARVAEMSAEIARWRAEHESDRRANAPVSGPVRRALEALGYVE